MKSILSALLFVFLWSLSSNTVSAQEITSKQNEYFLTGKLKKQYIPSSPCGFEKFNYVFQFKIVDFNFHNYSKNCISIVIPCPETYGEDFFVKGKTYQLKLVYIDIKELSGLIFDEKFLKKNKLEKVFFVSSIKER